MLLNEYIRKRALAYQGGLTEGGEPAETARLTLIGGDDLVRRQRIREHGIWYRGSGDELLNFFGRGNVVEHALEPLYYENKRNYFWSVSSTEEDIKRTHSGQPRNIVDTLVGLIGTPTAKVGTEPKSAVFSPVRGEGDSPLDDTLAGILEECGFWETYSTVQLPMTLVEGWGAWKVGWDLAFSDHPFAAYYRAEDVDFVYRAGKVVGMIFKDWYVGEDPNRRFLVTEFRYLCPRRDPEGAGMVRDLMIETRAWAVAGGGIGGDETVVPIDVADVPGFAGMDSDVRISDFDSLLATPCVFYRDGGDTKDPGRSIFFGKEDLFDDLDQELSQMSNSVRRSTPQEKWDVEFLERNPETGMPEMPKAFDRKFMTYVGGKDASGAPMSSEPVQVTQPNLNFDQYSRAAVDTLGQILAGIMSPATMGIGVAAQSTQESQREKEKVTVSTRNHLIDREGKILKRVFSDLLCCEEYLRTGRIVEKEYDVSVRFGEFADATFEEKATVLSQTLDAGGMSPEMYVDKLYGDSLSDEDRGAELEYVRKTHDPDQGGMMDAMGADPEDPEGAVPPQAMPPEGA